MQSQKFSALSCDKYLLTRLNSILPYLIIIVLWRRISSAFYAYSIRRIRIWKLQSGIGNFSHAEFIRPCVTRVERGVAVRRKCRRSARKNFILFCDKCATGPTSLAFCNFPHFHPARDSPRCRNLYLASFSAESTEVCTRRRVHYASPRIVAYPVLRNRSLRVRLASRGEVSRRIR